MENNTEKTDRYFRERLERFEQNPGDSVWENLARELGHKKRRNLVPIFRIAAGMAVIMSLGISGYFISRKQQPAEIVATVTGYPEASVNDTVIRARAARKNTQAVPAKKTPKSDRTEHIRKFQRLPDMEENDQSSDLQPAENTPALYRQQQLQDNLNLNKDFVEISGKNGSVFSMGPLDDRFPVAGSTSLTKGQNMAQEGLAYEPDDQSSDPRNKRERWILGGEFAPLYSYRTIASNSLKTATIDELNEAETGMMAYAGGIHISFPAGKRLTVQSGIYYSRYGQEKNNPEILASQQIESSGSGVVSATALSFLNSTGNISMDQTSASNYNTGLPDELAKSAYYSITLNDAGYMAGLSNMDKDASIIQNFDYLEVPLILKYKIINRKFDFSVSGGMVTNILIGNEVMFHQDGTNTKIGKTDNIRQVNYIGSVGLGLDYPVGSELALSIEPRFRYYLNAIDRSSKLDVHPYSFGLFAGISYFL
jgi:hypothetical protein